MFLVQLDLVKAFDSVGFGVIQRGAVCTGAPRRITEIIRSLYHG